MSKHIIALALLVLFTTACNRTYGTPAVPAEEIQFTQPMGTTTPTALLNTINSIPTQTPPIVTATAAVACSNAPAPHIRAEQQVTVTVEDWDKLKLRSDPSVSSDNVVLEMNQYTQLRILDGPICFSSVDAAYLFWKVAVIPSGEIGWVAEGDSAHYFIE